MELNFLKSLPQTAPSTGTYLFKDDFEKDSSADYARVNYLWGLASRGMFSVDAEDTGLLEIRTAKASTP